MGTNTNTGQSNAVTVYGNPESFKKLIANHGQLCKVKQALVCPCVGANNGSPDFNCSICSGDGYVYTNQRRFMVTDENSRVCGKTITPFWNPILDVIKVENVTSDSQGGITELEVSSFNSTTVTLTNEPVAYEKKRVTYVFDGWTYVESELLSVDVTNSTMYASGVNYTSNYRSSNPLGAKSDIAQVERIWNSDTGTEISNYTISGNSISTDETIEAGRMYMEYYTADLTEVITTELNNTEQNEPYSHDIKSGECKMAFYPYWELSKGDLVVLVSTVLYKNEQLTHRSDADRLHEIEIFSLNDKIFDQDGNIYYLDTDYILQGRFIKWITSNKPTIGKIISVRYGYKPSYVVFDNNPMPNNLENKQYPVTVLAKSWSKIKENDIVRLLNN